MDSYSFESLYAKKDLKDKKKYDEKQNLEDKLAFDKYEKKDKDKYKDKSAKKFKSKEKYKDKGEKNEKKEKVIKGNDKTKKKKKGKFARVTWQTYIHKVLKTVHEDDCTLSSKAMQILDSFANDLFERISTEAVKLLRLNNKKTLTHMEIQTASRLVLPGELCKHALSDGAKAVSKYGFGAKDAV